MIVVSLTTSSCVCIAEDSNNLDSRFRGNERTEGGSRPLDRDFGSL